MSLTLKRIYFKLVKNGKLRKKVNLKWCIFVCECSVKMSFLNRFLWGSKMRLDFLPFAQVQLGLSPLHNGHAEGRGKRLNDGNGLAIWRDKAWGSWTLHDRTSFRSSWPAWASVHVTTPVGPVQRCGESHMFGWRPLNLESHFGLSCLREKKKYHGSTHCTPYGN